MRVLLDTHLVLWTAGSSRRLSSDTRSLIEDPANDVHYSAASVWEIAIKSALRRRDFHVDVRELVRALTTMELMELPVTSAHAAQVPHLPSIHRDPFDRMLVAQSIVEPMILLTNDSALEAYGAFVRLV